MSTLRIARIAVIATFVSCVLFIGACTKSNQSSNSLLDTAAVRRLPTQTLAFLAWDSSRKSYSAYRQSPWGKEGNVAFLDSIRKMAKESKQAEVEKFIDILVKTGLLTTTNNEIEVIRDGAAFITAELGAVEPSFGVYLSASDGANLRDKLAAVESLLKSEGYESKKRSGSPDGFSVTFSGEKTVTLHFAATNDLLAVASQEALLAGGFSEPTGKGIEQIKSRDGFELASRSLPNADSHISYTFIDLAQLAKTVKSTLPSTEQTKSAHSFLDTFPGRVALWTRSMDESLRDSMRFSVAATSDDQRRWVEAMSGKGKVFSFQKLPADVLIGVTIDGEFLHRLKEAALAEASAEVKNALSQQLSIFDGLESFSIALRSGSGGSPFPELILASTGSNVEQMALSFRAGVEQILQSMNINLGNWQKKQVEKASLEYLMSPLGIGAFLARSTGSVVLASSEASVVEVLKSQSGTSPGLEQTLPKGAKALLASGSNLAFSYANFHRIGSLVENVQGSLALFTGGQGGADAAQIQTLKNMGAVAGRFSMENNVAAVDVSYETIQ